MPKAHVSINVTDVSRSVAFYQKFFGVTPVKLKHDYAKFDLETPGLNFTMNQRPPSQDGEYGRLSHLGIQVESHAGVAAFRERLEAAGMIDLDEEDTVCCYARQDKVWATDPDGNAWEVFFVIEADVPSADFQGSACRPAEPETDDAAACCG